MSVQRRRARRVLRSRCHAQPESLLRSFLARIQCSTLVLCSRSVARADIRALTFSSLSEAHSQSTLICTSTCSSSTAHVQRIPHRCAAFE
ncbi:hypothetical protein BD311DRAFT_751371 [Dichomitus squalens]|uniref:Uncharacterized protein n=1 Tax=Dichomitus squalens TaxID=114155 RepID=A0A4Q9MXP6_9APHY|nr:hypothetical protein BD311DRAFT_751371 [Dichomitus squalens]